MTTKSTLRSSRKNFRTKQENKQTVVRSKIPGQILSVLITAVLIVRVVQAVDVTDATLRVAVLDPNGALIVSAMVQVKAEGGSGQSRKTNEKGEAVFSALKRGRYSLRVEAEGFKARDVENLDLGEGVNQIKVQMDVAKIEEDVLVKQDDRERRTDPRGNAFTTILTEEQIAALPDDPEEFAAALQRMAGPGAVIRVNGFRGGRLPPKSQIRQIRFRQNSYAAEYHEEGFISVDIITKSATGAWYGSLEFIFKDESLNARNAFAPRRGDEQSRFFNLTLGGPILRNRTAAFFAASNLAAYDVQTIAAALPQGLYSDVVRRPSRTLNLSAQVDHALTKTHTLYVEYQRNGSRSDNLGVGNLDLIERAFSSRRTEHLWRLADSGPIGKRVFNEIRFQARMQESFLTSATDAPAILVPGAFNRGGAQIESAQQSLSVELANNIDFSFRQHAMRAGFLFEGGHYRSDEFRNTRGTFLFASIDDFRVGRALTFVQRIGDSRVKFTQHQFGWYLQDDFRLNQSLTLSFGLRHELQSNVNNRNNLAPRLGFAWSPFKDGRTTIRGGAGLFYNWLRADIYATTLRVNGEQQQDIVIRNPGLPGHSTDGTQIRLPPSRIERSPLLRLPYIGQASMSVDRQVGELFQLKTSYVFQRGVHLLRGHDINAPIPGSVQRPDPLAGNVVQVESSARSTRHLLNINLNSFGKRIYYLVDYSLSKSVNESDDPLSLPSNNFNLRAERGPAIDDARHRLYGTLGVKLFKGLRLATTLNASTALPYNITTGFDDNGDTTVNDRPAGISRNSARGAPQWSVSSRFSWNIDFGARKGGTQSRGSSVITVSSEDVGALTSVLEAADKKWHINFHIQAYNLLNRTNLINFVGVQTSPFYGQATTASPGRQVQAGMQFSF